MDLTTLVLLGSLLTGLLLGDAVLFGDSLYITMNVPTENTSDGPSQSTAEGMFGAEIARYTSATSVLRTPSVETSSQPRLAAVLAKPLGLQGVVYAAQSKLRAYGVVGITATIARTGSGPGLRMFVVIANPPDPPLTKVLTEPSGDWRALIHEAAREAMVEIAPFRVARVEFHAGLEGDKAAFDRCRQTIVQGLAQPWDPREEGATEDALLYNLSGLLQLMDKNIDKANQDFVLSEDIRGAAKAASGIALLNQAFVAMAQRQTDQADRLFRKGAALVEDVQAPSFAAHVTVLQGLIALSTGDAAAAEADFHAAIRVSDDDPMPHNYLADMLETRGESDKAKAERAAGVAVQRYEGWHTDLAHTLFRVDPVHGGYQPLF